MNATKKWFAPLSRSQSFTLILVIVIVGIRYLDPFFVEFGRLRMFDLYQWMAPQPVKELPVAIVDVDEESLAATGQWPWPRNVLADLTNRIAAMQPAAIAFDMLFPEPDRMSPDLLARSLVRSDDALAARIAELPDNDALFADAIKGWRVVLGQALLERQVSESGDAKPISGIAIGKLGGDPTRFLFNYADAVRNIAVLEGAASGLGVFTLLPESDGVVRRLPGVVRVGDQILPSLAISALTVATGAKTLVVKSDAAGVAGLIVGQTFVPTDEHGRLLVHYSRHDRSRFVSAKDILAGQVPANRLAGRIVVVGSSASGLSDFAPTPVSGALPGVEVHAQVLEAIVSQNLLQRPRIATTIELLVVIASLALVALLMHFASAKWTLAISVFLTIGLFGGSWWLFSAKGVLIDATYAAVATFLLYVYLAYVKYVDEERTRSRIRSAFSHYLAPQMVDRLVEDPSRLRLGGENREITVMFCDVRGFTSISENLDPEDLVNLVNRIFTPLTDVIHKRQGTVDKYIGDCIMAFWNAPLSDADHARNACLAALEMQGAMADLNRVLHEEAFWKDGQQTGLSVGIGINTGICCVGNMGSEQRFDYSVLGDSVNLASRLEAQGKTYACPIVVGETTFQKASDVAALELDLIRVVGKKVPVRIYGLVGSPELTATDTYRQQHQAHTDLLAAYRAQDWDKAEHLLRSDLQDRDGTYLAKTYALYQSRITELRSDPPPRDWDAVYVARSK